MSSRDQSQPADPRPTDPGHVAAGNEGRTASPVAGDSPTEGTVEGPLAPQVSPGSADAPLESEMRPKEGDARKSDGMAEFKKMQDNAEAGRE